MKQDCISLSNALKQGKYSIQVVKGETTWIFNPLYEYWFKGAILITIIGVIFSTILAFFNGIFYLFMSFLFLIGWMIPLNMTKRIGLKTNGIEFDVGEKKIYKAIEHRDKIYSKYYPEAINITYNPVKINFDEIVKYTPINIVNHGRVTESQIAFLTNTNEIIVVHGIPQFIGDILLDSYNVWKQNNDVDRMNFNLNANPTKLPPEAPSTVNNQ